MERWRPCARARVRDYSTYLRENVTLVRTRSADATVAQRRSDHGLARKRYVCVYVYIRSREGVSRALHRDKLLREARTRRTHTHNRARLVRNCRRSPSNATRQLAARSPIGRSRQRPRPIVAALRALVHHSAPAHRNAPHSNVRNIIRYSPSAEDTSDTDQVTLKISLALRNLTVQ